LQAAAEFGRPFAVSNSTTLSEAQLTNSVGGTPVQSNMSVAEDDSGAVRNGWRNQLAGETDRIQIGFLANLDLQHRPPAAEMSMECPDTISALLPIGQMMSTVVNTPRTITTKSSRLDHGTSKPNVPTLAELAFQASAASFLKKRQTLVRTAHNTVKERRAEVARRRVQAKSEYLGTLLQLEDESKFLDDDERSAVGGLAQVSNLKNYLPQVTTRYIGKVGACVPWLHWMNSKR
jgi:hypothetical protein